MVIFVIGSWIGYHIGFKEQPLPVYGPQDFNPKLVDSASQQYRGPHHIGSFSLTNQEGHNVTEALFKGKIYVADFFFSTCPGICPVMSTNLSRVFEAYKGDANILLISHSVTPETDTPSVLKNYAKKYGVENDSQWHFVTGDKKHIYELARKHYFAAITEGDGGKEDFIHSENFVLVGPKGRIRGAYDGTSFDEVDQLIKDIKNLKQELP